MTWASLQRSTQPAVSRDRPTVSVGGGVVETAWAPGASSREDMSPDGHCCVCRYTSEQPFTPAELWTEPPSSLADVKCGFPLF